MDKTGWLWLGWVAGWLSLEILFPPMPNKILDLLFEDRQIALYH